MMNSQTRIRPQDARFRFRFSGISLKSQLIISFLAVTLLVLSVSMYYSYVKTLDILEKRTQETTLTQFRQIETNILTLLHQVDNLSKTFIHETEVQNLLENDGQLSNVDFIPIEKEIDELMLRYYSNYNYLDSIYIFTESGMVVGGTESQNQSSTVLGRDYPFYSMPIYRELKESDHYPELIWRGGFKTRDFMRHELSFNSSNDNLITAFKGIKLTGMMNLAAQLVLNIDERHLNAIYGSLLSGPDGAISIVDDGGTVISSTLSNTIGESYLFLSNIVGDKAFGRFSASRVDVSERVFYYRMKETGWLLVDEVSTKQYMNDFVMVQRFSAMIFVLSVVLIVLISSVWMNRIMHSLQQLIRGMRNVGSGRVGITLPSSSNNEIGQLIEHFNRMSTGIQELMQENEESEKEKRRLEIEALQAHIDPHFLFNTLNTVKWMAAVADVPNIKECLTSLGNMLRPIYYQPSLLWSIEEEITFVKNYVNIMNYRYGEELAFEFDMEDTCKACQTLRFIIQPLIENTLVHGNTKRGTVRVSVREVNRDLLLDVTDSNGGIPAERVIAINNAISSDTHDASIVKGIGLFNVNKRVQLHFGEKYGLRLKSEEGVGTSVYLRIPRIDGESSVQKM